MNEKLLLRDHQDVVDAIGRVEFYKEESSSVGNNNTEATSAALVNGKEAITEISICASELMGDNVARQTICHLMKIIAGAGKKSISTNTTTIKVGFDFCTYRCQDLAEFFLEIAASTLQGDNDDSEHASAERRSVLTVLEQLELYHVVLLGPLEPLVEALSHLSSLKRIYLLSVAWHDDERAKAACLLARLFSHHLPRLESAHLEFRQKHCFSFEERLEIVKGLCQNPNLRELNISKIMKGQHCLADDDKREAVSVARQLYHNVLPSAKQIHKIVIHDSRVSPLLAKSLAELIRNRSGNLTSLSLNLGESFCIDPLVEALNSNPNSNLKSLTFLSRDLCSTVLSEKAMDFLLSMVETSNYSLKCFRITTGSSVFTYWNSQSLTMRQKKETLYFYLTLNESYERKRVLTDKAFTTEDLVELLTRRHREADSSTSDPERLSIKYALLLMKPEVWIPSYAASSSRNSSKRKNAQVAPSSDLPFQQLTTATGTKNKRSRKDTTVRNTRGTKA